MMRSVHGALAGCVAFLSLLQLGGWAGSLVLPGLGRGLCLLLLAASAGGAWCLGGTLAARSQADWQVTVRSSLPRSGAVVFVAAALAVLVLLAVNAVLHDDPSWDGNVYHIPAIGAWNQAGRLHWITQPYGSVDLMNGYPHVLYVCRKSLAPGA